MRIFTVLFLVACGGPVDSTIDITHDPCSGVTLRATTASDSQRAGIDAAIALWGDRGVALTHVSELPTIEVVFEQSSPAVRGLYDDETGTIYINAGLVNDPLSIVIAHEVGHAFGLEHVTGRTSLMNSGNLQTPPNDEDVAELEAMWGACAAQPGNP